MDRYEYNVKSDQIKKYYSQKDFESAAEVADEIDWYKVKDNAMLNKVADIYENIRQYDKAKEILLIAYERSPLGRQLAYKLTILALRTKNFVEADEFYQDFVEMAPTDVTQYLLKYRIAKAKGEHIDILIEILEAYVDVEMDERWQYELAKLYHEAGRDDDCIRMCKELELWFNEGKYVNKARELKEIITGGVEDYNTDYSYDNYQDNFDDNENQRESFTYDLKALQEQNEYDENSENAHYEEYQNEDDVNSGEHEQEEELVSDSEDDILSDNVDDEDDVSQSDVNDVENTFSDGEERVRLDNASQADDEEVNDDEEDREDSIDDEEKYSEVKSLAESILQAEEENDIQNREYNNSYDSEEDGYEEDTYDEITVEDMGEKDVSEKYGNIYSKSKVAESIIKAEEYDNRGNKYNAGNYNVGAEKYYKGNRGTDEQIRTAQEALKIAMDAAVEAQRAADIAKRLVEEATINVNVIKGIPVSKDALTGGKLSTGIYAGMTIDELRKQLDEEDIKAKEISERESNIAVMDTDSQESESDDAGIDEIGEAKNEISQNTDSENAAKEKSETDITGSDLIETEEEKEIESDSKIEIFEFDRSKEGKGKNIGDELTKTAEIDISEINFRLDTDNDLYNTANIQEALAQSMATLMGEPVGGTNTKKPTLSKSEKAKEYIDEASKNLNSEEKDDTEQTEEINETAVTQQETSEEDDKSANVKDEQDSSNMSELNQEIDEQDIDEKLLKERLKEYYDKQPTKVIDQKEINRILKATQLKNVYETVPLSPLLAQNEAEEVCADNDEKMEEQIEGQMTIDEILSNVNAENNETEETIEEDEKAEEKTVADTENQEITVETENEETTVEAENEETTVENESEETTAETENTITNIADMNEISHEEVAQIAKAQESIFEEKQDDKSVEDIEADSQASQAGIWQTETKPEEPQESMWQTEAKPEESQESMWQTETKPEEPQESMWQTETKPEEPQESMWQTEAKPEEPSQESMWQTETKPEEPQESMWQTETKPEEPQASMWQTETKPEEPQTGIQQTEANQEQELSAGAMSATDLAREVMAALDMGGSEKKTEAGNDGSNKVETVQPQEEPPQIVDASEVKGEERLKINSQPKKNQNVEMAELVEEGEEEKEDPDVYVSVDHRIPDNYKDMFKDFASTDTMEKGIADTLNNLINKFVMDGTSQTNNLIITGSAKSGKTTLGLSIIKASNRGRKRSKRRVAKVKATVLNKRGVAPAMTQIIGTDLIIEQAGNLMPNTIKDLMTAMKGYTEEMLVVLEDDKAAIDRMLDNNLELRSYFNNRLDIEELEINDMVKIAKEYAATQFYEIDAMGELALYARLDDISGSNPLMSIEDIQEVIDEAIEHEKKFSFGKIFGKMKKGKGDMSVLTEQDFQ